MKNIDDDEQDSSSNDDSRFILWKTELSKELLSFWESMADQNQE